MAEHVHPFLWKREDQGKYYTRLVNDYIRKLFKHLKENGGVWYLIDRTDQEQQDTAIKYYSSPSEIDLEDFHHSPTTGNLMFTITDYDEEESETQCGQCGLRYGGGIWFNGVILDDDSPYEGYIKTWSFFSCDCDSDKMIPTEHPWLELRCDTNNVFAVNTCIIYDLGWCQADEASWNLLFK